jgi:L-iditol 2-dehydrogenase
MMRAAYVPAHNRIEVGDFPRPVAQRAGDLVVQMHRASICGSDVHAVFDGFLEPDAVGAPGYPGHEGVGVVVESCSTLFAPGEWVLTVPVSTCGGCFTEYQLIDDGHVVALPEGGDPERLLMAQQYGTTLYAMRTFWQGGHAGTVAIIGAGSAGLFFVQEARLLGFSNILISDLNEERLAVASSLGANVTVLAPAGSLIDAVKQVTNGVGADLVIEAAGYDSLRADAIEAVRNQGTVGFFGYPQRYGMAQFPMYAAFRKSARIQWVVGTQSEPGLVAFRDAIQHINTGLIEVDYCLTSTFALEKISEAMQVAREQGHGAVKLMVDLT